MHPATNAKKSQQKLCTTLLAGGFVVVLGLAANKASAIAPIGDDASLFVTGVATVAYNDNIFLSSSDAKSSGVYDLVPGLSYEYGTTGALTKGFVRVSEDFQEFSSYSSINNQLFNGEFSNTYEDAMSKIDFDASMHQLDQPEYGIQSGQFLVDRNVYHIAATGEQKLDASSSIGAGIIFDDTDYRTPGYTDLKTTAIPVNYYLAVDPKLDFSFGGRVRFNTLEGGDDSTDIYVDIGARGEFTPNLTGEVDVGYNHQEIDVGNGTSGIGADASLTYAYSPKTNIIAGLTDDFGYDAFGDPFRYISVSLGFNSAIDEQWAIDGAASYGYYSYLTENRQDNFYTVQAGISYIVSLNFKVRAGYTLYNNDSTVGAASFNNDIFSVTGTLRF